MIVLSAIFGIRRGAASRRPAEVVEQTPGNFIAEDNLIGDPASVNAVTGWFGANKNFQKNLSAAGDTLWAYDTSTNQSAPQLEAEVANNYLCLMGDTNPSATVNFRNSDKQQVRQQSQPLG